MQHKHAHIHTHMNPMTDKNSTMLLWVYTRAVAAQLVISLFQIGSRQQSQVLNCLSITLAECGRNVLIFRKVSSDRGFHPVDHLPSFRCPHCSETQWSWLFSLANSLVSPQVLGRMKPSWWGGNFIFSLCSRCLYLTRALKTQRWAHRSQPESFSWTPQSLCYVVGSDLDLRMVWQSKQITSLCLLSFLSFQQAS